MHFQQSQTLKSHLMKIMPNEPSQLIRTNIFAQSNDSPTKITGSPNTPLGSPVASSLSLLGCIAQRRSEIASMQSS